MSDERAERPDGPLFGGKSTSPVTGPSAPTRNTDWYVIFRDPAQGDAPPLPPPPPWRSFVRLASESSPAARGSGYIIGEEEAEMVNAALYLRRPLLITGKPGTGKSTLAHAAAYQLGLNRPLAWPITTRSTLAQGLYRYDAVGRLHAAAIENERRKRQADRDPAGAAAALPAEDESIGDYLQLGPFGTALAPTMDKSLRVLLIDEIDKSDIDLPNDLLNVLEEGEFVIPELARIKTNAEIPLRPDDDGPMIPVRNGRVQCDQFPLVLMTSNGERDFPPAFLRRCLRLQIQEPTLERLTEIVVSRLSLTPGTLDSAHALIREFYQRRQTGQELSTDQLLNALYLVLRQTPEEQWDRTRFEEALGGRLLEKVLTPLIPGGLR